MIGRNGRFHIEEQIGQGSKDGVVNFTNLCGDEFYPFRCFQKLADPAAGKRPARNDFDLIAFFREFVFFAHGERAASFRMLDPRQQAVCRVDDLNRFEVRPPGRLAGDIGDRCPHRIERGLDDNRPAGYMLGRDSQSGKIQECKDGNESGENVQYDFHGRYFRSQGDC